MGSTEYSYDASFNIHRGVIWLDNAGNVKWTGCNVAMVVCSDRSDPWTINRRIFIPWIFSRGIVMSI